MLVRSIRPVRPGRTDWTDGRDWTDGPDGPDGRTGRTDTPYPAPPESKLIPITGEQLVQWQGQKSEVDHLRYSLDQSVRRVKELLCYFKAVDKALRMAPNAPIPATEHY